MSPTSPKPTTHAAPADFALASPPAAAAAMDIRQRVVMAQATMLFELAPRPVIAGAVFSLLVAVLLWPSLGGPMLLAWAAARVLISALRVWDCRRFIQSPPAADELPARWRRFMLLMLCECASWSAMGLLFAEAAPPQTGLVLLAGLVAVAAVSVFSLGSDFRACGAFVGVVLLPNAVHQFNRGTPEGLVTGSGMMILLVLLLIESAGLSQRIAELLRLRHENAAIAEDRQRARLLAEHSSQAKSRFLATVSHEMRTPLNGILGMTQLMKHASTDPAQRPQFEVIEQSGRHLQSVIGDLLDMSRIESGKLVLNDTTVRLHDLVREVVDVLQPMATQKGLRFEVDEGSDLPEWIETDASRVKQVLHNLLGNAIKFTASGEVALRGARIGEQLEFTVRDTGIGIPPEQLDRIFNAFEQVALPGSPEYRAGTGLGLTISRYLARAMHGDVVCAPNAPRGSVFRFTLPCRVRPAPPAVLESVPAVELMLSARVLVAEDSPVNAMITKAMLERMGLDVDVAEDGRVAVERLQQTHYAVVLMDCQMPVMDGWQATRQWRDQERQAGGRRTPIIALTANAVVGDRERCIAAGMDDYLPKPFEIDELSALIRQHVAS
jgi:signal transduction histidine kinase/ActR/RegA family two-component response regulator